MLLVLRMVTVTVIYLCATYICFAIYFSSPIYIYMSRQYWLYSICFGDFKFQQSLILGGAK